MRMNRMGKWVAGTVVTVAALAAAARGVEVAPVLSNSMAPTLRSVEGARTWVVVEKVTPRLHGLSRWDVVTFEDPRAPGRVLIKRVVALPGERVEIRGGSLVVDGRPVPMPEGMEGVRYGAQGGREWVVPAGHYFVLGDNSAASVDSRVFGPVPEEGIQGRMVMRFEP